jgi:ABC-2 type transport system permease protein/oleandomycin transport system permease protein
MATTTTTAAPVIVRGSRGTQARWAVADAAAMTRRNLLKYLRLPQLLVFSTIQPVMFVLLFTYVFGGAIHVRGLKYIDYFLPGIYIQSVIFGSAQTGVGLADDMSRGMIDRFRSLPMARSAVLAGRTLSDTCRNVFVVLLMTGVGTLIGFRFHAGFVPALAAMGLAVLFGLVFSWISALIGMSVRDPEVAQSAGIIWVFPLIFASSAFVPVQQMPHWLQAFVRNNPITYTVDAIRALCVGQPTFSPLWHSLAWMAGLLVVFVPLSVVRYRRVT